MLRFILHFAINKNNLPTMADIIKPLAYNTYYKRSKFYRTITLLWRSQGGGKGPRPQIGFEFQHIYFRFLFGEKVIRFNIILRDSALIFLSTLDRSFFPMGNGTLFEIFFEIIGTHLKSYNKKYDKYTKISRTL